MVKRVPHPGEVLNKNWADVGCVPNQPGTSDLRATEPYQSNHRW